MAASPAKAPQRRRTRPHGYPTPTIRVEILVDHKVNGRDRRFRVKSPRIDTENVDAAWDAIARAQLSALIIDAKRRLAAGG